jgi:lipopolysaccharide assembly outer membrane protein LptD (OstA)
LNKPLYSQLKIRTLRPIVYTFVIHLCFVVQVFCQTAENDTLSGDFFQELLEQDSVLSETDDSLVIATPKVKVKQDFDTVDIIYGDDDIKSPISYSAKDSIVYDVKNKKLYLYHDGKMKYDDINIEAERISFDWTTSVLVAEGVEDSMGVLQGTPIFKEKDQEYFAKKMEYNFKSGKGKTYEVVTEEGGAFIHTKIVKKNEYDEWYGYQTWYTTCDDRSHPHFYIEAKKSKVVPGKVMVTGPANLVVGGVNTPLYLPFGIFPTNQGRRSGIIFPEYGDAPSLGFFLRNGGYYWAVSDKLSLAFTADIYTRGTFRVGAAGNYVTRYKYNGNFAFDYTRTPPNDKIISSDGKSNDFRIQWTHTMDPKAKPNNSFTASVTGASQNFNDNTLITTEQALEVQLSSNINYSRRFQGKPYSLSLSARHNQNLKSGEITIAAPEAIFNLTRIQPFQKKIRSDKKAFYENIGFQYSTRAKSYLETSDSTFFSRETLEDLKYGIQHDATVDVPFNLFKYFRVNPSFRYTERWYFEKETRRWDPDTTYVLEGDTFRREIQNVQSDFENGFFGVRNFVVNTDINTTLTGIYNFKGERVKAMRHVVKPNLRHSFSPDFGKERWGYWDSYYDERTNRQEQYSRFDNLRNIYGVPPGTPQNTLSFSVTNNFEMKKLNKQDSVKSYKNVPIIDNFTIATGYNFAVDSLKIQPLVINAASTYLNNLLFWNFRTTLNPYTVDSTNRRINTTEWQANKRLLRLQNMTLAVNLNFSPKSKSPSTIQPRSGTIEEREFILNNPSMFYDFNIPWSLRVGYNIGLNKGTNLNPDSLVISTNSITFGGHVNITPKWQINLNSGFNVRDKEITLTNVRVERDLHCWVLAFNWTAFPVERQTYAIDLHVKSPILQELKLSRKQPPNTTGVF